MSFPAKAVSILIASPDDVISERNAAEAEIHAWNASHAVHTGLVLLPVRWETHAIPQMGNHPQVLIDEQILRNADLVIGIFRFRLGTPTQTHQSGTAEEIELHAVAGKPAQIYFSTEDLPRNYDREQFAALENYREQLKQKALYASYSSLEDFKDQFRRNLALGMNLFPHEDVTSIPATSETKLSALNDEAKYLLIAAAAAPDGRVCHMSTLSGESINAGEVVVLDYNAIPRQRSVQLEALRSLQKSALIMPTGDDNQFFEVTQYGYETADNLNKQIKLQVQFITTTPPKGDTHLRIKANKAITVEEILLQTPAGATISKQSVKRSAMVLSAPIEHANLIKLWNSKRDGMSDDRSGPAKLDVVLTDEKGMTIFPLQVNLSPLMVSLEPGSLALFIEVTGKTYAQKQ